MDRSRAWEKAQESSFLKIKKITENILKDRNSKTFEARSVHFHPLHGILEMLSAIILPLIGGYPSLTAEGFPDTLFNKDEKND
jgi:hypothetical protein